MNTTTGSAAAACCQGSTLTGVAVSPVIGRYDLIDHFGCPVTERSYAGRFQLILFGFTHCAVVCPRELRKMARTLELLGTRAQQVQPLYITVDPARDTHDRMRTFLASYHSSFVGLTGTSAQVDIAKANFRVFAARKQDADAPDGYVVPHTAISYLLDCEGSYLAHFTDAVDADAMVNRLDGVLRS